jgi:tRNA (cytidine/uridine-2'-O-)-methyltransferase
MFNIVLVEPEIPQNTGNISRSCAVTGSALHLVRPLGFEITDSKLKRAGLDYWDKLEIYYYDSFEEVARRAQSQGARMFLATTKGAENYADQQYRPGDYLVFGKETAGLGERLLASYPEHHIRIPMRKELRSLNLSNSVAIVLYEALRQTGFPEME